MIRKDRQQEAIMTVQITRNDLAVSELRRAAAKSADASAARRKLAIALILDGHSRQDAAQQCGMDRQTLRDWVHRFNAEAWLACRIVRTPAGRSRHYRTNSWRKLPSGCA